MIFISARVLLQQCTPAEIKIWPRANSTAVPFLEMCTRGADVKFTPAEHRAKSTTARPCCPMSSCSSFRTSGRRNSARSALPRFSFATRLMGTWRLGPNGGARRWNPRARQEHRTYFCTPFKKRSAYRCAYSHRRPRGVHYVFSILTPANCPRFPNPSAILPRSKDWISPSTD